jgi:hypothetical protein
MQAFAQKNVDTAFLAASPLMLLLETCGQERRCVTHTLYCRLATRYYVVVAMHEM